MTTTVAPIPAQMLGASSVIAAKIAASGVTRAKLQYSALQLHVRASRTVASVAGTNQYTVNIGFSCRSAWARISHNSVAVVRFAMVKSIRAGSGLRIIVYSKTGNRTATGTIRSVPGVSARIYWTALR